MVLSALQRSCQDVDRLTLQSTDSSFLRYETTRINLLKTLSICSRNGNRPLAILEIIEALAQANSH